MQSTHIHTSPAMSSMWMWVWAHSAPNAHPRRAPGAAPPSTAEPTSVASLQQRGVAWMFALCGVCRQRQACAHGYGL